MRRIDIHTHFISPDFADHLEGRNEYPTIEWRGDKRVIRSAVGLVVPVLDKFTDLDVKLADMDELGVDFAVLSHAVPGPEVLGGNQADEWARRMNDHLAGLIARAPDRISAWGLIGFGDPDTSRQEMDRCVKELRFPGFQLYANIAGQALDAPGVVEIIGYAAELGVPLNLHPTVPRNQIGMDNLTVLTGLGFVADTSLSTLRLIFAGVFDRYPELTLIVPHIGGVLPYIRGRIAAHSGRAHIQAHGADLERPIGDYLQNLFIDSVTGDLGSLRLAYDLMGPSRILYGTDHPFGNYRQAAGIVDQLGLPEGEQAMIYSENAMRVLGIG